MQIKEVYGFEFEGDIDSAIKKLKEYKALATKKLKDAGHDPKEWSVNIGFDHDWSGCYYEGDIPGTLMEVVAYKKPKQK